MKLFSPTRKQIMSDVAFAHIDDAGNAHGEEHGATVRDILVRYLADLFQEHETTTRHRVFSRPPRPLPMG